MVSKRDKVYFSIVTLFGGLAGISLLVFFLTKNFILLVPTLLFVILMYVTIIIGFFDKKR